MRLLGAMMISLSVALLGISMTKRQRQRLRQLSQCVELIQTIAVEIRYGCYPISDILRRAAQNEAFSALAFLKKVEVETASDFSTGWKKAIENTASLALKPDEKAILFHFGSSLGTTDTQTQLLLCERFHAQLNRRLEEAAVHRTETMRLTVGGTLVLALILFALFL